MLCLLRQHLAALTSLTTTELQLFFVQRKWYGLSALGALALLLDLFQVTVSRFLGSSQPKTCRAWASSWPCCSWTPGSIARKHGDLRVFVSHGVEETTGHTVKSQMRLQDFAELLSVAETAEHCESSHEKPGTEAATPYLKQLDLGVELPNENLEYSKNLCELDVALRWWGTSIRNYLWMGSLGCVTGLHCDDEDNFLVQCHGTKRVCLFPPDCAKHLYVNSKYDSGTLCCDVNVFEPDYKRHPLFRHVGQWEMVELQRGDVLFIPAFWWHSVLTTSRTSISLNSFISRPLERFGPRGLWRYALDFLHNYLGYRMGNCVCHAS